MSKLSIISGIVVAWVGALSLMLASHLALSHLQAERDLVKCETRGGIACHIERDGLDYGVYSW